MKPKNFDNEFNRLVKIAEKQFGLQSSLFLGGRKKEEYLKPKRILIKYLSDNYQLMYQREIAEYFTSRTGQRIKHSTICAILDKFEDLYITDKDFKRDADEFFAAAKL